MIPEPTKIAPTPEPTQSRSGRGRALLRSGLRLLLLSVLGFLAVLFLLQDRIIFPGTATQGTPQSVVHPPPGAELLTLTTSRGERVAALYGPALLPDGRPHPDPASRPALVYFYGNAMCLAYCGPEFDRFRRLGLNVLIPDFLGYGQSGGKASEVGCRETAETAYQALRKRGFPANRIIAGGWSLGGAVAIDLASRQQVAGLIAFSTFTNTHDMALRILPVPLPRFMFVHKFDSLSKISRISCPILLGHGRKDPLVPFAMFEQLARAVKAPLTKVIVNEAGHNDFYDVGDKQIDQAIRHFVARLSE
ncbi:MAG: alpha/beta hydrolase [Isosphaeraceae bacterium]